MSKTIIPANYTPALNLYDTQRAIGTVKRLFADTLCATLNLYRVSAPLFLEASTGLNDDLNGVERKVTFDIKESGIEAQVVQSLAKWKRKALKDYDFRVGKGLYCDMNAIRRDEDLDNLHSIYVDQWDWEKVITKEERTRETLEETVRAVYKALKITEDYMAYEYDYIGRVLPEHIEFITSQELEDLYPDLTPKQREYEIVKLHGNIELGPLTGLSERIVDITATGRTLRENNLVIVDEVLSSTARFFANPCAFRTDPRVVELADKLRAGAEAGLWDATVIAGSDQPHADAGASA